jgi:hypothetical protein
MAPSPLIMIANISVMVGLGTCLWSVHQRYISRRIAAGLIVAVFVVPILGTLMSVIVCVGVWSRRSWRTF